MFTSTAQSQRALAKIILTDGKSLIVSVKLPMSGKLLDAFNNADAFLDIITGDGTQQVLNKSMVARAEAADPPRASLNQQRRSSDKSGFNPYAVLGVDKSVSQEDLRTAYLILVKAYHPDRFASLDMPQEMKDYATSMQARINMAYQQLES
jgi:DnaJ-domain-containing protein 1